MTQDITISSSTITSMRSNSPHPNDPPANLLLPTLCHPHIHLDKPYLLTCNHPKHPLSASNLPDYSDLAPKHGSFTEALTNTSAAKERFTEEDLYLRGSQLLATSYTQGVTSARCFVEVDHITRFKTLEVGLRLKREFGEKNLVEVQLCVFAQDPIFSTEHGEENRKLIEEALSKYAGRGVDVLGSTPYVETDREASEANIEWAVIHALEYKLHLDFHLDYNLTTPSSEALTRSVISTLRLHNRWPKRSAPPKDHRTIVLGHCTALTTFSHRMLKELYLDIYHSEFPVYLVALPTSDLYMMGRPDRTEGKIQYDFHAASPERTEYDGDRPLTRPRGTIDVVALNKDYRIKTCLGVNNVGNTFTPFGTGDPLALASLGVGLYHAGTEEDANMLYDAISTGARRAIGLEDERDDEGSGEGEGVSKHGMLLVRNEEWVGCPGHLGMKVPARQRRSVRDVVWDVPDVSLRRVIRG